MGLNDGNGVVVGVVATGVPVEELPFAPAVPAPPAAPEKAFDPVQYALRNVYKVRGR